MVTRNVLVTGAAGFIGRHLLNLLLEQECQITAVLHPLETLHSPLPDGIPCVRVNIQDKVGVTNLLRQTNPAVVFHLAGLIRSPHLAELLAINVLGTENVLQAARELPNPPRVVIPGSAAEYGVCVNQEAVLETAVLRPVSAYGVSKAAQTHLALAYAQREEVPVMVGRLFNVTGPGESAVMLAGGVTAQIVACEAGQTPAVVQVGNLSAVRDFVDVRDVVRALWAIAQAGSAGEVYNVCSGNGRLVADVVYQLMAHAKIPLTLANNSRPAHPGDVPYSVGNPQHIQQQTGWCPHISLSQSLTDLLQGWRGNGQPIHRPGGDKG